MPTGCVVYGRRAGRVNLGAPTARRRDRSFAGEEVEGDIVDAETFAAVVASIDDFRIRVDLNSKFEGDELNGLDDVVVE